jgi:hypothetical protein
MVTTWGRQFLASTSVLLIAMFWVFCLSCDKLPAATYIIGRISYFLTAAAKFHLDGLAGFATDDLSPVWFQLHETGPRLMAKLVEYLEAVLRFPKPGVLPIKLSLVKPLKAL